jgi:MFS family permease
LSSLQKEFYLSSKETGIYVSVYDIGSLISSILVSFASARGSKPRWIAFGMVALFIGCMIDIIPHFIKPKSSQNIDLDQNNVTIANMAKFDDNSIELCNYSVSFLNNETSEYVRPILNEDSSIKSKKKMNNFSGGFQLKYILYLGNMINGFSSASLTTITFSYIEDMAPPHLSAVYESIYYAVGAFGVGVGFIITSKFLTIHTDINEMKELPGWLKPSHPNWIGAWWLPFLLFGFISLILAAIIFSFPKKLNHDKKEEVNASKDEKLINEMVILSTNENNAVSEDTNEELVEKSENEPAIKQNGFHHHGPKSKLILDTLEQTGSLLSLNQLGLSSNHINDDDKNINHNNFNQEKAIEASVKNENKKKSKKELIESTLTLLKKPIYFFVLVASAIEGLLQNSFLAFAALFLEYQYRLASGTASLVLGLLSIPPVIFLNILKLF